MVAGLTRVRTRDQVGGSQQIQEVLRGDPLVLAHVLVFHHGDVRGGSAKAGGANFQADQHQFN